MDGSVKRLSGIKPDIIITKVLFEELNLREEEYIRASEANRDLARYRFMNALEAYSSLVIHSEPPK